MGVNLVPIVRDFSIHSENFTASSHDVQDGCVTPGTHRVMRFDFLTHNKGNADLVAGDPEDHPEWYVESASHGHYHLIDFNEFLLYDASGNPTAAGPSRPSASSTWSGLSLVRPQIHSSRTATRTRA